jgi:hypothetical protein
VLAKNNVFGGLRCDWWGAVFVFLIYGLKILPPTKSMANKKTPARRFFIESLASFTSLEYLHRLQ